MSADDLAAVRRLLRPGDAERAWAAGGVVSSLPGTGAPTTARFEGLYGGIYDRIIQTPAVRRGVFGAWGSADPLRGLEAFAADAAPSVAGREDAVLLDLPSGGGTLLPLLQRHGFRGTAVEVDLAETMLARAARLHETLEPGFETLFVRADARDLPFRDGAADVVVSINGLHVVEDRQRFLAEIARVTKPGGGLWLITPVAGPGVRSRTILRAASALSITPSRPPARPALRQLLAASGFDETRDYGGESIAGFALRRRPPAAPEAQAPRS